MEQIALKSITHSCSELIVTETAQVLQIQFNRPERRNALSLAVYAALADLIVAANQAPEIRVLMLTGDADCFTSGNDLVDFMNEPEIHAKHPVVRFMRALHHSAKPVVAKVRGPAIGIGTTMLLHCDLVYAADNARLQLPFVNLGLCPEYAASYLLPRLLGHQRASELLLLGEVFDGAQAQALGLVNAVVPDAELDDFVAARLARLSAQPPAALRRTKVLLRQASKAPVELALEAEFIAFAEGLASAECQEAVSAFFEKRMPDFSQFE